MPLSPSTPRRSVHESTIAAINAALVQAGLASTTGNVFFCDPVNGLDTNNGQVPASSGVAGVGPVQSLAAGYAFLRSGYNDVLVLIGNGTSTGSARITTFTWAKNAAHLFGICAPSAVSQRARIANPTTAGLVITANFFTVSGNGCLFSNLSWFQGAGAGQTGIAAAILVTITGSRNAFINCDFEGMGDTTASADAGSRCLLISGGGQENFFKHCNLGLDTVQRTNANSTVEIAGGGPRNIFEDCTFLFDSSDGLQYALLGAAAAALDRWVLFEELQLHRLDRLRVRCDRATVPLGRSGRRDSLHGRADRILRRHRRWRCRPPSPRFIWRAWPEPPPAASRIAGHKHKSTFQRTHHPQNNQRWCGLRLPSHTDGARRFLNAGTPRIREIDACRSRLPASFDAYRRNLRQLPPRDRSHERNSL